MNPEGENISVTVKTTDGNLTVAPPAVAIPGSPFVPNFRITGSDVGAVLLRLPGTPVGCHGLWRSSRFRSCLSSTRRNNLLQLTNFHREDTFNPNLSADGQRVFFSAGADPLGTNPTENCQIFSIDRNGGDLRQLTNFHEGRDTPGQDATHGRPPQGCTAFFLNRDAQSGALVFYSTCDPFGTNPYGAQLFAMHPDGTGLRQLTATLGYMRDASGAVTVELPFPLPTRGKGSEPRAAPGPSNGPSLRAPELPVAQPTSVMLTLCEVLAPSPAAGPTPRAIPVQLGTLPGWR